MRNCLWTETVSRTARSVGRGLFGDGCARPARSLAHGIRGGDIVHKHTHAHTDLNAPISHPRTPRICSSPSVVCILSTSVRSCFHPLSSPAPSPTLPHPTSPSALCLASQYKNSHGVRPRTPRQHVAQDEAIRMSPFSVLSLPVLPAPRLTASPPRSQSPLSYLSTCRARSLHSRSRTVPAHLPRPAQPQHKGLRLQGPRRVPLVPTRAGPGGVPACRYPCRWLVLL